MTSLVCAANQTNFSYNHKYCSFKQIDIANHYKGTKILNCYPNNVENMQTCSISFVAYFTILSASQVMYCQMVVWVVINELKRIWKDGISEMLSQFSGTEQCHGHICEWQVFRQANPQLLIAITPALCKRIFCYTCCAPTGQLSQSTALLLLICFTSRE